MPHDIAISGGYTFGAPQADNAFVNSLINMLGTDLEAMLKAFQANPAGKSSEINALIDELLRRKQSELQNLFANGDVGAGQDLKTLKELMAKLKAGTITADEMSTLALMMGMDASMLTSGGGGGGGHSH
jgi:hypothetical protein